MNEGYWPNEGKHSEECRDASHAALMSRIGILVVWLLFGAFTYVAWVSAGSSIEPALYELRHVTIDQAVEALASVAGVAGTLLLATRSRWAGWGFVAFLVSNIGWLWFSNTHGHQWMFWQQVAFTISSVVGIAVWLLKDWILFGAAALYFAFFGDDDGDRG